MRKAYLVGLVAAGALAVGATASSAATANAVSSSSDTAATGVDSGQAYPAPVGAKAKKVRRDDTLLGFLIAGGVGATALVIALNDDDSPATAG